MVDIIRRKNINVESPDVSSGTKAKMRAAERLGESIGSVMERYGRKVEMEQAKADREYQAEVQRNIKTEQTRLVSEQKAFDAADKMVAADMAGRLKNDLLRWNLTQRENNPSYIGTAEHEKRMRDEYARLSNLYGQGLGEAGKAEFTQKTQSAVNEFISNDVKWAYQQKIKKGEESAKQMAETMNKTAGMFGANGDVDGFKESHKESRDKLKEYIESTAPAGASPALYELDKKSLVDFMTNMAQTDPVKAKAIMDSMENFKEVVPDDMLQGVNDIIGTSVNNNLHDKLIVVNAGLENSKKGSPEHRELEKQKKKIEKDIKNAEKEDYSEKSLDAIHKEVSDAVKPVLEKSLGESALIAKKEHEEEKVARFQEFMKLPTPENLKWFEEDNQMSYYKPEKNMSELPEDMKTKTQKNNELLENMMKYRENFGNVSMVEISDYKGTKQMFDDLKAAAQIDSDKDGNMDNALLKVLVAANNAKQSEISEKDYNNYLNVLNRSLFDRTYKRQLNQFMEDTKGYLPKHFWNDAGATMERQRTELEEQMNARTRDVLVDTVDEWAKGEMSGEDITKMYLAGVEKAYNDTVSDYLGFDMNQVVKLYKDTGKGVFAKIHGIYYEYHGTDPNGDPIWLRAVVNPERVPGTVVAKKDTNNG